MNINKFKKLKQDDFEEFITILLSRKGEFHKPNITNFRYMPEIESFLIIQETEWVGDRYDNGKPILDDITYIKDEWMFSPSGVDTTYMLGLLGSNIQGWFGEGYHIHEIYNQFLINRGVIAPKKNYGVVKDLYDEQFSNQ